MHDDGDGDDDDDDEQPVTNSRLYLPFQPDKEGTITPSLHHS